MANEIENYPTLQCNLEEHKQYWLEKMRKCQSEDTREVTFTQMTSYVN